MKDTGKKEENTLKIVRFTDGIVACYQGSEEEIRQKAKRQFPEKTIEVVI